MLYHEIYLCKVNKVLLSVSLFRNAMGMAGLKFSKVFMAAGARVGLLTKISRRILQIAVNLVDVYGCINF